MLLGEDESLYNYSKLEQHVYPFSYNVGSEHIYSKDPELVDYVMQHSKLFFSDGSTQTGEGYYENESRRKHK